MRHQVRSAVREAVLPDQLDRLGGRVGDDLGGEAGWRGRDAGGVQVLYGLGERQGGQGLLDGRGVSLAIAREPERLADRRQAGRLDAQPAVVDAVEPIGR